MTRLIEILISFAIVFALFVIVGMFLPSSRHLAESVQSNRKVAIAYDLLNNTRRFTDWNPILLHDPRAQIQMSGPDEGKGAKVASGQTVRVAYTGALWGNGKVFDSNATGFTTAIGVGQVVPGWDKSIVGQTVGSRLLLVVPPADGYGAQGQGEIKGTDTMVFVVDILAAV